MTDTQPVASAWTAAEEQEISRITATERIGRLAAIRKMRATATDIANAVGDGRIPKINVSKAADTGFMSLLEDEDAERYNRLIKNIRRDNPVMRMTEDEALTNFMLGLPTGQYRFAIIAGPALVTAVRPIDEFLVARKNLRKRIRQAKAMRNRGLSETQKSVAGGHTN